ncbi:MAG TPA: hypothetical protein DCZ10_06885 [Pelotomaculum sp.]|nr:hypothetical protein [Pelotomaculum sp.]
MKSKNGSATIIDHKLQDQDQCIDVSYPQVDGLKNRAVQNEINALIKKKVMALIPKEGCDIYQTIKGTYKVELNQKGILSVKFNVYTFRWHAANGLDVQKSITVDLDTGKVYQLYNLFKPNSGYRMVLTRLIQNQIKERNLPLLKELKTIPDNQEFYLTNDALVIYFQEIEYTPHYVGIPEFPIPYYQISSLVSDQGPVVRFLQ